MNLYLKKLLILLLLIGNATLAQDYVDLVRLGYSHTLNNGFENSLSSTEVSSLEADITFPVVLNDQHALITGFAFSKNRLQLFPESRFTSLYSSTLKLGLASTWNDRWSSTLVALPKIASDYENISGNDFYLGGFALLKFQKKENLIYRFGIYGSQEAFGFFTTPIIGWYYLSKTQRFEMDMSLPISADINYDLGNITLGVDYIGIGRSFNLNNPDTPAWYVDLSSLEFATYAQLELLEESVLLRGKLGYSSNDYEVYRQGEKIDLGVSAFSFGDDRELLNPSIGGGIFLKFEAIYRFHIPTKKEVVETSAN